jgi:hypothetical protein
MLCREQCSCLKGTQWYAVLGSNHRLKPVQTLYDRSAPNGWWWLTDPCVLSQVGMLSRHYLVEALRRARASDPAAVDPVLDCIPRVPHDAIVVSMLKQRRWWRRVGGFTSWVVLGGDVACEVLI